MTLLPRVLFSSFEVATRWQCTIADIVEWAAEERLQIMTTSPLVETDDGPISGFIELHAADLLPMFRRDGTGPNEVPIYRARVRGAIEWSFIVTPGGLMVTRTDILISASETKKFEEENNLVRRPSSARPTSKYEWDAMYMAVIKRIHDSGLPDTQAQLVRDVQDWFTLRRGQGDIPDERTIRRKLTPIWRELT